MTPRAQDKARPVVVYSMASYPPHPTHLIYVVIAGAFAYARFKRPVAKVAVELRLVPSGFLTPALSVLRQPGRIFQRIFTTFASRAVAGRVEGIDLRGSTLRISRYPRSRVALGIALRSAAAAIPLWKSCFSGGKFSAAAFLNLSHRSIRVGDVTASEYLRFGGTGAAFVKPSPRLLALLIDAIFICNLALDRLETPLDAAVYAHEPTYRHALYRRALRSRGLAVIEQKMYDSDSFVFVESDEALRNAWVARPSSRRLSTEDQNRVRRYMEERLASPPKHLTYMNEGFNRNDVGSVVTTGGDVLRLDENGVHIVLFLHSFDDAQYLYGSDGFGSLLEWAEFTIQACLRNPQVGSVLVKGHPNQNSRWYPKTTGSERWLERRFADQPRVAWIDRRTSLRSLANIPNIVGITHTGSVAEETVFVGIPTVGFRNGPWREGYEFVRTWHDVASYDSLLADLSVQDYHGVTAAEQSSLESFVREYRLSGHPDSFDNLYWFRQWLASDGRLSGSRDDEVEAEIAEMDEQAAFEFLSFLAANANGVASGAGATPFSREERDPREHALESRG